MAVLLLLSHHSPAARPIPITSAEAWELEVGETVKRASAGVGGSTSGSGVVRTGREKKVRARVVGGGGEGGTSVEEKDGDGDEGKGQGKEGVEGKGSTKGEEEKPNANEGEKEDVGEERKLDSFPISF